MQPLIILTTINAKNDLYAATSDEYAAVPPNIQLGLLYTYLRSKGLNVEIIEAETENILIPQLIDILERKSPLLTGIICTGSNPASSTMTMTGVTAFFEAFNTRKIGLKTFVWGPHPTVLPERTLRETRADYVVRGEGWESIPALFDCLRQNHPVCEVPGLSSLDTSNGGAYRETPNLPLLDNLDILPGIDWERMHPARYRAHNWHAFGDIQARSPYAIVWTSFGCPYPCNFCSINNLFERRTQRFRSIRNVIDEISLLREKYHVRHIKILDELFVANEKRIDEFCDLLEPKGYDLNMWAYSRVDTINRRLLKRLKKVGMNWLSYGFETASKDLLKSSRKGTLKIDVDRVIRDTQEENIAICADVIFGQEDETPETMDATYDFLVRYNFEWANIYPVFPYPGTVLFTPELAQKTWKEYSLYGYECIPMGGRHLTPAQVLRYRDEAFVRYHSRPEYLAMIETKFGRATRDHILTMIRVPLRRRILEHQPLCATP